jgi:dGTP triphosphohydrolase
MQGILQYTTDQSLGIIHIEQELNTIIVSYREELQELNNSIKKQRKKIICAINCIATLNVELKEAQLEETVARLAKFIPGNTKDNSDAIQIAEKKIKSIKDKLELEYIKEKAIIEEYDKNVLRKNELEKPIRELRIIITRIYNSIINTMTLLQSFNYLILKN